MLRDTTRRVAGAVIVGSAGLLPALACAQTWSLQGGAVVRGEYNDNYFFQPSGGQSAWTASITPFVTAARRTETSDVAAVLAVGGNRVWVQGPSPTTDYASVRAGVEGTWREASSTWKGNVGFERKPQLQTPSGQPGGEFVLAYTNSFAASGAYTYALAERWSLGATAAVYSNTYDSVSGGAAFSNNHGYVATGKADYVYAEGTQFTFEVGYPTYFSGLTDSSAITATAGVVHRVSPQLTLSASGGGYWSELDTAPSDLLPSTRFHESGPLYGGSVVYALSERTLLAAALKQNLTPSSYGSLTRISTATLALTHDFSERLTGRLGAYNSQIVFPVSASSTSTDRQSAGEVGLSYRVAERWTVDAAYRYTRAHYGQTGGQPTSNLVFLSFGYNWPGQSFTDWIGTPSGTQGLPAAGPLSLPDAARESSAGRSESSPERSPFEPFTIP